MVAERPSRGEVWEVDFGRPRGHEQGGRRPALVVSADRLNRGPAGLTIVVPMTTQAKGIRFHVEVEPPEGGLRERSFVKPEDVRSVSLDRLGRRIGAVSAGTLATVESRLRVLLDV